LSPWKDWLAATALPEMADAHENWRQCLTHLLTSRVEAWRDGTRRTVGQLLHDCENNSADADRIELRYARNYLAQAGLGLLDGRKNGQGFVLAIPHSGPLVGALFRDTVWAGTGATGGWASALRQAPANVVPQKGAKPGWNVVKINGVAMRCTLVKLDGFRDVTEGTQ
jgi:hypothetical protein